MRRGLWLSSLLAAGLLAVLLAPQRTTATSGFAGRVGSVNIGLAFLEYQRKKDLDEEMRSIESSINLEMNTRRSRIDSFQTVLDAMNPEDPTFLSKSGELLKMQIEFRNWFDLKQADMSRKIGIWTARIYGEINVAIAEVAQRDGYDVVLYHDEFNPGAFDPEQLQDQIARRRVLYVSPGSDLTRTVIEALNNKYRNAPRAPMLGP